MFGGDAIGDRRSFSEIADVDQPAEAFDAGAGHALAGLGQRGELAGDLGLDRSGDG